MRDRQEQLTELLDEPLRVDQEMIDQYAKLSGDYCCMAGQPTKVCNYCCCL